MKNIITFEVSIPQERLINYIERASIGYWGSITRFNRRSLTMTVCDEEDGKENRYVNLGDWAKALQLCAATFHNTFKDLMSDSGDMYTGDILIQLACFGEEKYS